VLLVFVCRQESCDVMLCLNRDPLLLYTQSSRTPLAVCNCGDIGLSQSLRALVAYKAVTFDEVYQLTHLPMNRT
jgi:hypothetical protein